MPKPAPNKPTAPNAGIASRLTIEHHWPGVGEPVRWANNMRVFLPLGISLELADGWLDVSDDLPPGSPFTLARSDGVGAFQLSAAIYQCGRMPNADIGELVEMLALFGKEKGFDPPSKMTTRLGDVSFAGGSFVGEDFIRIWYVTNGRSFVFASYVAATHVPAELADCEAMVSSIRFKEEPNKIATHEPPQPDPSPGTSVHRTLDSLPVPAYGGGR
ncbi:MAG: hypothetical protein J0M24_05045 [Verrucomicrobia bacterium]|nr:hypothetical protein [Verrucomicrobiota bacterium]